MKTKKNLGRVDRVIRMVIGIGLLALVPLAFFGPKLDLAMLGLIGLVPLAAGITGFCPPYKWLGLNTYKDRRTVTA